MKSKIKITVEAVPPLSLSEQFVFLLKELFELVNSKQDLDTVKRVCVQHESFDVHCGGSHVAIINRENDQRLVLVSQ